MNVYYAPLDKDVRNSPVHDEILALALLPDTVSLITSFVLFVLNYTEVHYRLSRRFC